MCRRIVSLLCLLPKVDGKLYIAVIIQRNDIPGIVGLVGGGTRYLCSLKNLLRLPETYVKVELLYTLCHHTCQQELVVVLP